MTNLVLYGTTLIGTGFFWVVPPTWEAVSTGAVLYLVTVGLGGSAGIHRGLVHQAYKSPVWLENLVAILGSLAGLGGPISFARMHFVRDYVQTHAGIKRVRRSSSLIKNYKDFLLYSHRLVPEPVDAITDRLRQRPLFRLLEHRLLLATAQGALLYVVGGASFLVWTFCLRLLIGFNGFACLDHFCHSTRWGTQRFKIRNVPLEGRNIWLLGVLLCGEGWHNNHHAMPRSPQMGLGRWELDLGHLYIKALERVGLAWDVMSPKTSLKPGAETVERE